MDKSFPEDLMPKSLTEHHADETEGVQSTMEPLLYPTSQQQEFHLLVQEGLEGYWLSNTYENFLGAY